MRNEITEIEFSSEDGCKLRGRFVLPARSDGPFPLVVMATGDGRKGTQSETWTKLPSLLLHLGVASFVFDFSGLGASDGDRRDLTLSTGVSNLRSAMQLVQSRTFVDHTRIGLLGSSFGGNVALLFAATTQQIRCLGLKSPVCFYPDSLLCEFGQDELSAWEQSGYSDKIGFHFNFYLDALSHNAYRAAMAITCPCLITHGSADEVVPVSQSRHLLLALHSSNPKRLCELPGVGHRYVEPGAWDAMAAMLSNWFAGHLVQ